LASYLGCTAIVKSLLEAKANVDMQNKVQCIRIVHTMNFTMGLFVLQSRETALTSASASGSVEVVELLLEANAKIELEKMVRTSSQLFYQSNNCTVPVTNEKH